MTGLEPISYEIAGDNQYRIKPCPQLEWQPIETAPQDGKTKLILGAWSTDGEESTVSVLALEPEAWGQKPRAVFGMGMIFYPTHWMPLPEPPK